MIHIFFSYDVIFRLHTVHLRDDPNWRLHFEKVVSELGFDTRYDFFTLLIAHFTLYKEIAPYKRSHVQKTRFFETGDNFYLGMEFTREYDS